MLGVGGGGVFGSIVGLMVLQQLSMSSLRRSSDTSSFSCWKSLEHAAPGGPGRPSRPSLPSLPGRPGIQKVGTESATPFPTQKVKMHTGCIANSNLKSTFILGQLLGISFLGFVASYAYTFKAVPFIHCHLGD